MKIYNLLNRKNGEFSNETYIEAFKAIGKLHTNGIKFYEKLLSYINKIPDDKNGEYSKVLIETLKTVGHQNDTKTLDDYIRNFNHVNQYKNKGEETPQIILDAIEDIRKVISNK